MDLSLKLKSNNPLLNRHLAYSTAGKTQMDMLTKYERVPTYIYAESSEASLAVANEIATLIISKQRRDKKCVLGLPTGSTQIGIYEELVRLHKEEGLSFKNVITFNIDEYYPISAQSIHSYRQYMEQHLFSHIDILPENINIPDGTITLESVHDYCREYEKKINEVGGIDLLLLGIGQTGHIGFNEPGSAYTSKTRLVTLDRLTRNDAADSFNGEEHVPHFAMRGYPLGALLVFVRECGRSRFAHGLAL